MNTEKLIKAIALLVPAGVAVYLFRDQIARLIGLKRFAIIYFMPDDYQAARLIKDALGFSADIIYLSPLVTALPPEVANYEYIIFIGGQTVNPFYRRYMNYGQLPKLDEPGQYVIKQIGNYIFIAGYETEDTYKAAQEFVRKLKQMQ